MFTDGYFSLRFAEVIGFVITIAGIWLVVRQLNEARLASQMEGMLDLTDKGVASMDSRNILNEIWHREDCPIWAFQCVYCVYNFHSGALETA